MRVIAGKYGGRKLVAFKAGHIRPTTDRVKETIFNKLQFDIDEAKVLDLFAGTGSLSMEALSRGAASVCAVESHGQSVVIIEKNRDLLGIGSEIKIKKSDVLKYLKDSDENFDIILIDPPFTKKIAHDVMEALSQSKVCSPNTLVFIESSSKENVEAEYGILKRTSHKSYGDKFLSTFES